MKNTDQKQYVSKSLLLNSVPKSEDKTDNILVQGADKTVKFIPRSELVLSQVNTDWNSESGFSQLLNKPEFKTINGQSIFGDGDIVISDEKLQNLDEVLTGGNTSPQSLQFYAGGTDIGTASVIHTVNPYFNIIENKTVKVKNTLLGNAMKIESIGSKTTAVYQDDAIGFSTDLGGVRMHFPRIQRSLPTYLPLSVNGQFADVSGNITLPDSESQTLQKILNNGEEADNRNIILNASNGKYTSMQCDGKVETSDGLSKFASINYDATLKLTDGDNNSNYLYDRIVMTKNEDLHTFLFPEVNGNTFLVTSINGQSADSNGNVSLYESTSNLHSVLTSGSRANITSTVSIETSDSSVSGNSSFTMFPNVINENSTGMSLYTTGMMNVAGKAIDITNTQGTGSLYIKSDGATLNGNSKKVTINGGAGGVFVQGGGGGFTVDGQGGAVGLTASMGLSLDSNNYGFLSVGGETAGVRIESRVGAITMEGQGGGIIMNTGSKLDINGSTANVNTILNSYNQLNIRNNNGVRFYDPETYNSAISTLDTQTFTEESGTVKTVRNSGHFRNVGTLYTPRLVFEKTSNGTVLNRTKVLSDAVTVDNTINLPSGESGFKNMVMSVNGVGADQHGNVNISVVATNSTTTTLSASVLTSTYPQAIIGFRVQCMNIAGGAIIYEKTTLGWTQYPVSIVP